METTRISIASVSTCIVAVHSRHWGYSRWILIDSTEYKLSTIKFDGSFICASDQERQNWHGLPPVFLHRRIQVAQRPEQEASLPRPAIFASGITGMDEMSAGEPPRFAPASLPARHQRRNRSGRQSFLKRKRKGMCSKTKNEKEEVTGRNPMLMLQQRIEGSSNGMDAQT